MVNNRCPILKRPTEETDQSSSKASTYGESTWGALYGGDGTGGGVPGEGGGGGDPVEKELALPFHRLFLILLDLPEKRKLFSLGYRGPNTCGT